MKERQHVHAAKRPVQRSVQQLPEIPEGAARQPIDVRDQLRLVLHDGSQPGIAPGEPATNAPSRFAKLGHPIDWPARMRARGSTRPSLRRRCRRDRRRQAAALAPRCTRRRRTARIRVPPTSRTRLANRNRAAPSRQNASGVGGRPRCACTNASSASFNLTTSAALSRSATSWGASKPRRRFRS